MPVDPLVESVEAACRSFGETEREEKIYFVELQKGDGDVYGVTTWLLEDKIRKRRLRYLGEEKAKQGNMTT